ncbi:RNA polymerase sigma factor [Sinomicrobium sp.]
MFNSDRDIIQGLKADDKNALVKLYDAFWKPLFISSYNLLKDKEICEEIIQDVFIDLWNNRRELEIRVSLKSYLYACVRYKVFAEFRKNKPMRVELFEELNKRFQYATPETEVMHDELLRQVAAVVETLPKKCKEVYQLSRDAQLSHKEIAQRLNISAKTVENHIANALKILRSALGHYLYLLIFIGMQ